MKRISTPPQKLFLNLSEIVTFDRAGTPFDPSLSGWNPLRKGALLVEGESIVACGPRDQVEPLAGDGVLRMDLAKVPMVAAPGFVDSHTHAVFAGTRHQEYEMRARGYSYQEISRSGGGIFSTVRKVREASEDELFECSVGQVARFLKFGTTTVEIKSGYGLDTESELKMLRVIRRLQRELPLDIVPTYLGAHAVPPDRETERYLDEVLAGLPQVKKENLAVFVDVFCEDGFFTPAQARTILRAAQDCGFLLKIHADELSHCSGGEIAGELGCVSADHLEWVSDAGIDALAKSRTVATLLPGTVFFLGLPRYPDCEKLVERGVPVALATDFNPGTCMTQNMQLILTMACSQMKMTPAQAFCAATLNGAAALRLESRLGSLEPGKKADIAFFHVDDYRKVPYHFGTNHCVGVMKNGELYLSSPSPLDALLGPVKK